MAAGERLIGSDIKLAGYLKLLDNPIFLGLSDNAYITTSVTSSSIDIVNLSGDLNIETDNIFLNVLSLTSTGLLKYSSDLSGSYDNRTLIDKEYLENAIINATALDLIDIMDVVYPTGTPIDGDLLTYNGIDNTWEPIPHKKTWTWGASSNSVNNTNRYLDRHDSTPTNQSPYVAWADCKLTAVSLSSDAADTWDAEIRVNGITVATLNSNGNQFEKISSLLVDINAGDQISFYLNGTSINKPSIDALFIES